MCKFTNMCRRAACPFAHPGGRAPPEPCRCGLRCRRPGCFYAHPEGPEQGAGAQGTHAATEAPAWEGRGQGTANRGPAEEERRPRREADGDEHNAGATTPPGQERHG